jgi:hypothetical protein
MPTVAVLSDTHCYHDPGEAVPGWVQERIAAADHTIHAGDFVTPTALDFFREHTRGLTAVRGNADVAGVDLPEVATLSVGGVTVAVTHPLGVGDASLDEAAYERAVLEAVREHAPGADVAVAGHTHRVLDRRVDGIRLVNPGSASAALPADRATMLTLAVGDGIEVTVHTS